jgi:RNA polymerase sigma-70 factor (ECF subfamily)
MAAVQSHSAWGESRPGEPERPASLDLVELARQGDHRALSELFDRYDARVRRIVRARLGRELRLGLDSGDILQDTFLQATRAFARFVPRDEASLIHWLAQIAQHQIIAAADRDRAHKRDRRREVALEDLASEPRASLAAGKSRQEHASPLERVSREELARIVDESVRALPPDYSELILLRDYAGMSWETVAETIASPSPQAARMRHGRAKFLLALELKKRGVAADYLESFGG